MYVAPVLWIKRAENRRLQCGILIAASLDYGKLGWIGQAPTKTALTLREESLLTQELAPSEPDTDETGIPASDRMPT